MTKGTMGERMAKIETTLQLNMEQNKKEHSEIMEALKGLDKKYASKNSERVLYAMIGIILVWVLNQFLGLI